MPYTRHFFFTDETLIPTKELIAVYLCPIIPSWELGLFLGAAGWMSQALNMLFSGWPLRWPELIGESRLQLGSSLQQLS